MGKPRQIVVVEEEAPNRVVAHLQAVPDEEDDYRPVGPARGAYEERQRALEAACPSLRVFYLPPIRKSA